MGQGQEFKVPNLEAKCGKQEILFAGENFVPINESNFTYFWKSVPKISFQIRNANFWFIGAN